MRPVSPCVVQDLRVQSSDDSAPESFVLGGVVTREGVLPPRCWCSKWWLPMHSAADASRARSHVYKFVDPALPPVLTDCVFGPSHIAIQSLKDVGSPARAPPPTHPPHTRQLLLMCLSPRLPLVGS